MSAASPQCRVLHPILGSRRPTHRLDGVGPSPAARPRGPAPHATPVGRRGWTAGRPGTVRWHGPAARPRAAAPRAPSAGAGPRVRGHPQANTPAVGACAEGGGGGPRTARQSANRRVGRGLTPRLCCAGVVTGAPQRAPSRAQRLQRGSPWDKSRRDRSPAPPRRSRRTARRAVGGRTHPPSSFAPPCCRHRPCPPVKDGHPGSAPRRFVCWRARHACT